MKLRNASSTEAKVFKSERHCMKYRNLSPESRFGAGASPGADLVGGVLGEEVVETGTVAATVPKSECAISRNVL
jgi:hypothetical protein